MRLWITVCARVENFFEIAPERVVAILKLEGVGIEDVTPKKDFVDTQEDQQALNQARTKRSVFNFNMVDIPIGAELSYVNDENVKVKVADNRRVDFNGEVTYSAPLTQKLLGYSRLVQGAPYWRYNGETLDVRRQKFESEK